MALFRPSLSLPYFFFRRSISGPILLMPIMFTWARLVIGCRQVRTSTTRPMMARPQSRVMKWKNQRMPYRASISQPNVRKPQNPLV